MKFRIVIGILFILFLSSIILINSSDNTNDHYMVDQLNEIREHIKSRDKINKNVSEADIAWHLDHLLKAIKHLHHSLEVSDPNGFEYQFNIKKIVVFVSGRIPRGVGKAQKSVLPPEEIKTEDLLSQLEEVKIMINSFDQLAEGAFINHRVFGALNKQQTKRFIEIHTNHHLKIIHDILE